MLNIRQYNIMRNPPPKSTTEQIFDKIQELRRLGIETDEINLVIEGMSQREQIKTLRVWVLEEETKAQDS